MKCVLNDNEPSTFQSGTCKGMG